MVLMKMIYHPRGLSPASEWHERHWFSLVGPAGTYAARAKVMRSEVAAWCEEQFGPGSFTEQFAGRPWRMYGIYVVFKEADHAFEFRMRWC